jgi:hypothetical protein
MMLPNNKAPQMFLRVCDIPQPPCLFEITP